MEENINKKQDPRSFEDFKKYVISTIDRKKDFEDMITATEKFLNSSEQFDKSVAHYEKCCIEKKKEIREMFRNSKNIKRKIELIKFDLNRDKQILNIRCMQEESYMKSLNLK